MSQGTSYFNAPCGGYHSSGQSNSEWRYAVFKNNTYCNPNESNYNLEICNQNTNYFSKYLNGVWYGEMQPVTLRQLYSYSNPCQCNGVASLCGETNAYSYAATFCENLRYPNGELVPTALRPFPCGGSGSNIYDYNPLAEAIKDTKEEVEDIFRRAAETDKSGMIILAAVVLFIVIIVTAIIWAR